ncbi:MAG: flippase-like domain-containing protein [Armatimonadetes bacterium]|nr:flippase-like domain-containing protein [Armatimonadota bacterium]
MDNDKKNRQNSLLLVLRLALTIACIVVVLGSVDVREAAATTARMAPLYLALAVGAEFAQRVLFVLRWHVLLAPAGIRIPVSQSLRLGFVALFYNNFMPSTVGGDAAKSYLLARRPGAETTGIIASVLVDRLLIGWGSMLMFGLAAGLVLDMSQYKWAMLVMFVAGMMGAGVVWLAARRSPAAEPGDGAPVMRRLVFRAATLFGELSRALLRYRHHRWALVASFLISSAGLVVMGFALQFWAAAVGFRLGTVEGVAISAVMKIVGMIPATINGLGWIEGATVVLLGWSGMTHADALAIAVAQRIAGTVLSLLGAGAQWMPENRSIAPP